MNSLQKIFPTQGLNPGLHCRWILYHLSHQVYCGGLRVAARVDSTSETVVGPDRMGWPENTSIMCNMFLWEKVPPHNGTLGKLGVS